MLAMTESTGFLDGIVRGTPVVQRRAMAKAITLLESTRADHRLQADALQILQLDSARLGGVNEIVGVFKPNGESQ